MLALLHADAHHLHPDLGVAVDWFCRKSEHEGRFIVALSKLSPIFQAHRVSFAVFVLLRKGGGASVRSMALAALLWRPLREGVALWTHMQLALSPRPLSSVPSRSDRRLSLRCQETEEALWQSFLQLWCYLWSQVRLWKAPVRARVPRRRLWPLREEDRLTVPLWQDEEAAGLCRRREFSVRKRLWSFEEMQGAQMPGGVPQTWRMPAVPH